MSLNLIVQILYEDTSAGRHRRRRCVNTRDAVPGNRYHRLAPGCGHPRRRRRRGWAVYGATTTCVVTDADYYDAIQRRYTTRHFIGAETRHARERERERESERESEIDR